MPPLYLPAFCSKTKGRRERMKEKGGPIRGGKLTFLSMLLWNCPFSLFHYYEFNSFFFRKDLWWWGLPFIAAK
jgi:hypothetical protein